MRREIQKSQRIWATEMLGQVNCFSLGKNILLPACLGWEDPLEEGMATHLSNFAHGQRSLAGYGPWSCKELDMTERAAKNRDRKKKRTETDFLSASEMHHYKYLITL